MREASVRQSDRCLKCKLVSAVKVKMALTNTAESVMGDGRRVHNQTGQCPPLLSPVIGSFKVVAGDGTSVGTVIRLQCPSRHRAVSGSQMLCVWSSNDTHWSGGIPECKPLSRLEDKGFQLALLMSFISFAIILLMSFIFITSCLVRHVKREERKKMERRRERETAEFWQQIETEGMELPREVSDIQKIRNNNNNNNSNTGERRHTGVNRIFTSVDLHASCRCHLQEKACTQYIQPSQLFQRDLCLNKDFAPIPQPCERYCRPSFPCDNYPVNPLNFCAQFSKKEPLWNGQHLFSPHEPPAQVVSI